MPRTRNIVFLIASLFCAIFVQKVESEVNRAPVITIRKNTGATDFQRRRVNIIEGNNVTITVADDGTDNEVDVTIAATGGGSSGGGVSLFIMPNRVAVSTLNFPNTDFTISYDGVTGATITVKTTSAPWSAAQYFGSSVTVNSSATVTGALIVGTTFTVVGATTCYGSNCYAWQSSAPLTGFLFYQNGRLFTVTQAAGAGGSGLTYSEWVAHESTTAQKIESLQIQNSTSDTKIQTFINFGSTSDIKILNLEVWRSTTDSKINDFNNFNTTGDIRIQNSDVWRSTSDSQQSTYINFSSTGDTRIQNADVWRSTGDSQQNTYQNYSATADVNIGGINQALAGAPSTYMTLTGTQTASGMNNIRVNQISYSTMPHSADLFVSSVGYPTRPLIRAVTGQWPNFEVNASSIVLNVGTVTINRISYNFPSNDGDANQVLHTDGNGNLRWDTDDTGVGGGGSSPYEHSVKSTGTYEANHSSASNFSEVGISTGGRVYMSSGAAIIWESSPTVTSIHPFLPQWAPPCDGGQLVKSSESIADVSYIQLDLPATYYKFTAYFESTGTAGGSSVDTWATVGYNFDPIQISSEYNGRGRINAGDISTPTAVAMVNFNAGINSAYMRSAKISVRNNSSDRTVKNIKVEANAFRPQITQIGQISNIDYGHNTDHGQQITSIRWRTQDPNTALLQGVRGWVCVENP